MREVLSEWRHTADEQDLGVLRHRFGKTVGYDGRVPLTLHFTLQSRFQHRGTQRVKRFRCKLFHSAHVLQSKGIVS